MLALAVLVLVVLWARLGVPRVVWVGGKASAVSGCGGRGGVFVEVDLVLQTFQVHGWMVSQVYVGQQSTVLGQAGIYPLDGGQVGVSPLY